jgi:hypothetical protein
LELAPIFRASNFRIISTFFSKICEPGYLERTGVLYFVGAISSRDRFMLRLKAASTGVFLVTWTYRKAQKTKVIR